MGDTAVHAWSEGRGKCAQAESRLTVLPSVVVYQLYPLLSTAFCIPSLRCIQSCALFNVVF